MEINSQLKTLANPVNSMAGDGLSPGGTGGVTGAVEEYDKERLKHNCIKAKFGCGYFTVCCRDECPCSFKSEDFSPEIMKMLKKEFDQEAIKLFECEELYMRCVETTLEKRKKNFLSPINPQKSYFNGIPIVEFVYYGKTKNHLTLNGDCAVEMSNGLCVIGRLIKIEEDYMIIRTPEIEAVKIDYSMISKMFPCSLPDDYFEKTTKDL